MNCMRKIQVLERDTKALTLTCHSFFIGRWKCEIKRVDAATGTVKGVIHVLNPEQQQLPSDRLPGNVVPSHYDLDLIIPLAPDFNTIDGFFSMQADVITGTVNDGTITMHQKGLLLDESSFQIIDSDNNEVTISSFTYEPAYDFVTLEHEPLAGPGAITLSGKYVGEIVPITDFSVGGFFTVSYVSVDTGERIEVAGTQFETDDARTVYPCLDEPAMKATFKVRIGRPVGYTSLSNGVLLNSDSAVEGYDGYIWDEYDETVPMSTYLTAFIVVTDFINIPSGSVITGVIQGTSGRSDAINRGYGQYAASIGPRIIQAFEELFQKSYALPKMDQIALPMYGGAMENYGMIVYQESVLLIDEAQTGAQEKQDLLYVNAHENAHQWFGNDVTCDWWHEIWLNEGFATYFGYVGSDAVEPEMEVLDVFYPDEMYPLLRYDGTTQSHPILKDPNEVTSDNADFGIITYQRGGSMLRMLQYILTYDTLLVGLRTYLSEQSLGTGVTDELWENLDQAGHNSGTLPLEYNIKQIMDPWLKQSNYPVLTVERDYVQATAQLSQRRFLTDPENASGDNDRTDWYIPYTYTAVASGQSDFEGTVHSTTFLEPNAGGLIDLEVGGDTPVIFNIQNLGYYRVDYDSQNWNMLINQLNTDHTEIHVTNRAQLLNDGFALAEADIQDYDLALSLTEYLEQESEYPPFAVGVAALTSLADATSSASLLEYLTGIVLSQYRSLGVEEDVTNTHPQNRFHQRVISAANYLELAEFDDDAVEVFEDWMASSGDVDDPVNNPVNRHLRPYVYCAAVRREADTAVPFLQERLQNTALPQEAEAIRYALRCPQVKDQRDELDRALKDPSFYGSRLAPIKQLVEKKEGLNVAFKWIQDNFEAVKAQHEMFDTVMESYKKLGNTEDEVVQLDNFLVQFRTQMSSKEIESVTHAVSAVKHNIKLKTERSVEILAWLNAHKKA